MRHMRYREFVDRLQAASKEDEDARIIKSRAVGTSRDVCLSLVRGKDGGIAIVTTPHGGRPRNSGGPGSTPPRRAPLSPSPCRLLR